MEREDTGGDEELARAAEVGRSGKAGGRLKSSGATGNTAVTVGPTRSSGSRQPTPSTMEGVQAT